ncbi:MAG: hypothetical protein KF708_15270 [Pirellulales bacterium]|nr:hypothetical protein [Pirellulales bacterium]
MAMNPYEAPAIESTLAHPPPRRYRRWPWPYKIALAIVSTVTTMIVLLFLSEFLTFVDWLLHHRFLP